jgi:hypothetical protein
MPELRERLGRLGDLRDAVADAADRVVALELEWGLARDARAADAEQLRAAVADARTARVARSDELDAELAAALAGMTDDAVFGVLDPELPLVLLPVGIETRFTYVDGQADELLVRILPDEVHVQSHEPELTDGELRLGRDYWTAYFRAGRDGGREASAWAPLAGSLGPARAAWVKDQLTPLNVEQRPAAPVPEDDPLAPAPDFPEIDRRRAGGWTRPAIAGTLPDRWLAIGWQGAQRAFTVPGAVVPDELQIGPSPYHPTDDPPPEGTVVEPGLGWLVDFAEAEAKGMGIRIKLAEHGGLDRARVPLLRRLAVVGVSASIDGQRSAQRLAGLVEDHAHTEGFGFLPIGTATNNTAADSTVWTARAGADGAEPPTLDLTALHPHANAPLAARALGLAAAQLAHVPFADGRDQVDAEAMQTLLWSATGGYLFDHLWRDDKHGGQIFSPATRSFARSHFIERVRARGPLPTLRVGSQPYGLLPATATERWAPDPSEGAVIARLVDVLRAALVLWKRAIGRVPSVTRGSDVLEALGIAPVSQSVHVRAVAGGNRMSLTHQFELGPDDPRKPKIAGSAEVMVDVFLAAAGFPKVAFPPLYAAEDARRLWLPLARPPADTPAERVEEAASFLERVMDDRMFVAFALADDPATLLAALARHAATLELALAAEEHEAMKDAIKIRDQEIIVSSVEGVAAGVKLAPTMLAALQTQLPSGATLGNELVSAATARVSEIVVEAESDSIAKVVTTLFPASPSTARSAAVAASAAQLAARLREQHAAGQDGFEALERLVGEGLDLWSHRLDAWVTSIATRRLDTLRAARPDGVQLGGYGFVEDLHPGGPPNVVREDAEGPLLEPLRADGSLLAPSIDQAVTAAILRSGQLTHQADGAFAVDLPSARARIASEIAEGVREGQPLGALLGYRIERRLHDRAAADELPILNAVIGDLRRIAGLPPGALPPVEQPAAEAIGAQSVIDGLRLLKDGTAPVLKALTDAQPQGAPLAPGALTAVEEILDEAARDVDAVADLLLAESVFQLSTGRTDRAAATLDALAGRGALPGEPEVLRTPRRGTAIAMRVLVAAPADATAATWGWPTDGPRAQAEPRLDAWAASVLGNPSRVRFDVAELDDGEAVAGLPEDRWVPGSLPADLGALDLLALAAAPDGIGGIPGEGAPPAAAPGGGPNEGAPLAVDAASSPLLLAIVGADGARRAVRPAPAIAIDADQITLLELAALARSAAAVLAAARDPAPGELGADHAAAQPTTWSDAAVEELRGRAVAARDRLDAHAADLAATPFDAATIAAAVRFGVAGAGAAVALAAEEAATAALTREAALARVAQADALLAEPPAAGAPGGDEPLSPASRVQRLLDALGMVFGAGFRAVPIDRPPLLDDLVASATGLRADGGPPGVRDWLDRQATARSGCGALADLLLQADALPAAAPAGPMLAAAQAPYVADDGWLGEADPKPRTAADPRAIPTAFAVHGTLPAAGQDAALLVVDEWSEVVPAAEAVAGLAFAYDAPGARPPQAILLAVHPVPGAPWDVDTLAAVVDETATLAQVRMVDLEAVSMMGAILPALYAAQDAIGKAPKLPIDLISAKLADAGLLSTMVEQMSEREA